VAVNTEEERVRLEDKVAIVVGAGQTPGETIGNGRATALLFAREGAKVLAVDRDLSSAKETEAMIRGEGGEASAFEADIVEEAQCQALATRFASATGASTCSTTTSASALRTRAPWSSMKPPGIGSWTPT
jgi:NAD(P)-dependent dehydrogenase (short-subunit alcohol dehydrogenase family)